MTPERPQEPTEATTDLDARLARLLGWTGLRQTRSVNTGNPLEWQGSPPEFHRPESAPKAEEGFRRGFSADGDKLFAADEGRAFVPHFSTRVEHAFAPYGPVAYLRGLGWGFALADFAPTWNAERSTIATFAAPLHSSVADEDGGEVEGVAPLGEDARAITLAGVEALELLAQPQPAQEVTDG